MIKAQFLNSMKSETPFQNHPILTIVLTDLAEIATKRTGYPLRFRVIVHNLQFGAG
jgi:hypothetical protein